MNAVFDAHCHLAAAWADSQNAVSRVSYPSCCCGTGPADWAAVQQAAGRIEGMVPAYGIHPWWLPKEGELPAWLNQLEAYLMSDPEAAVGEIGLDAARRPAVDLGVQRAVFLAQLEMAQRLCRVAVVHCVRDWGVLCDVLETVGPLPRGLVLHAFNGSPEMVACLARYGSWFSVKLPLAQDAKSIARIRAVPLARLLLESDVTLSEVHSLDDTRAMLMGAVDPVARLLGMSPGQLAALATANAIRCFG